MNDKSEDQITDNINEIKIDVNSNTSDCDCDEKQTNSEEVINSDSKCKSDLIINESETCDHINAKDVPQKLSPSPTALLPQSTSDVPSVPQPHSRDRSISQEVHQIQTQLSFRTRFSSYLRIKSKLVCSIYFIISIFTLFILILIATIILWYWRPISLAISIEQHIERKGQCLPLKVTVCQKYRIPYAYTVLPNKFGQTDQLEISQQLIEYEPIISVKCYALLPLFLCSQLAPKCNSSGYPVPPCRTLCKETQLRCNFFLAVFTLQWPQELDCDQLPESSDPDICVGYQENRLLSSGTHFCGGNGFRCDSSRCIPYSWKCDGFADCRDFSDEKFCSNCTDDQFYCGNNACINKEGICDGINDCSDGRDERQCLRLSESMGQTGEGRLEAWSAQTNSWQSVCGEDWNVSVQSDRACHILGYKTVNETKIRDETTAQSLEPHNRVGNSIITKYTPMKILFDKRKNNGCRNGKNMAVFLKCDQFECGKSTNNLSSKRRRRIVGGNESNPGQWPWLVAIHGGPEEVFFCGGVLISQRWILTAAHCIGNQTDISGWTVNLGATRRTASPFFVRKRKVSRLLKHPGFNPSANMYSSDIALILLDKSVDFDEFLRPICLPESSLIRILPGTYCTVIGWGKAIHDDDADYLSTIHEVQVPIVSHKVCAEWYSQQDVIIPKTMLCAGYEQGKKDACQGDSGGPLLCRNHDQSWFVAGVVSWGINCAQPQLPGIYTNVPMFLEWILAITDQMGYPLTATSDYETDSYY